MKNVNNAASLILPIGSVMSVYGWLSNRKIHGKLMFINIADSQSSVQVVVEKNKISEIDWNSLRTLPLESGLQLKCFVEKGKSGNEFHVKMIEELYPAELVIQPRPRSNFDIFDPAFMEQMLRYRHLYLRNPKVAAILKFRSWLMGATRDWFEKEGFMEFDAPILTPAPLYDGSTAMPIEVHGEKVYLSQCAGFYLEAAAHAFERVYNMGPSFRGEESRSKRHLMEYWHIKAELTWGNREDIINIVEDILTYLTNRAMEECGPIMKDLGTTICTDALKVPYPRITHQEAINMLRSDGDIDANFDTAISTAEEEMLAKHFDSPFWIIGIPRAVEPFPYVIDKTDTRITMVADLIASNGFGELLGVAEKIFDPAMLNERMAEKGKLEDPRYSFVHDVHKAGCVPHIAFGMGLERLIRWFLQIPHVRDAIPFPRVVRRNIMP
jgi:asparaginyl-tRNA synthetase